MNVLIIEDEAPAARRLQKLIMDAEPHANVLAVLDSIESGVEWLQKNTHPHLLFLDIQLSDGTSFEIFKKVEVKCPVIFTTAYDEYALQAFKVNSIDYLLKPIEPSALEKSISKFRHLRDQFIEPGEELHNLLKTLQQTPKENYKSRFLVKTGQRLIPVSIEEVAYFYAHDKMVYMITTDKRKYPMDHSLDEMEEMLNPQQFFRANRQFIIALNSVAGIHHFFNSKLKVQLNPAVDEDVIVSREKAGTFKSWLDN